MKSTALKLALAIAGMVLSALLLRWADWDGWFVTFIVAFLLSLLYCLDLGQALRGIRNPNRLQRVAGLLLSIPQALLGLACIGAGGAIVLWVLYNSLVTRLPEFSGIFLSFGIGPALVWVGSLWLRSAVSRSTPSDPPPPEPANSAQHGLRAGLRRWWAARRPRALNECLRVEFDEHEIRVRVLARLEPGWNATVAWQDIQRVCFKDEGLSGSDLLFLTARGHPRVVPVLMEAAGGAEFFGEICNRGLFPEALWHQAMGETGGRTHCWPPHDA
jgi:hypothetical protein